MLEPPPTLEKINPVTAMPATLNKSTITLVKLVADGADGGVGKSTVSCGISGQRRTLREIIIGDGC